MNTHADLNKLAGATPRKVSGSRTDRTINLALQGGGAHGAFTWGVLDRLLEEDKLSFEGVVATSAGAMNAAVMAYGMAEGGRRGAQKALSNFWRRVSHAAAFSPLQPSLLDRLTGSRSLEHSPAFLVFDMVTRLMSPYQFNPMNFNPLKGVLEQSVDLDAIRMARCPVKLHICATNVRTGKVKVFDNDELSIDAIMASACLPFLFQAVEIDGEAYWDGGYMGNPALFPLFYNAAADDVLLVQLNPIERKQVPRTAQEIQDRMNEITFNATLLREFRAVEFVQRLVDQGLLPQDKYKRVRMHRIDADKALGALGASTKMDSGYDFLLLLKQAGQRAARAWLKKHFDDLGVRETLILRDEIA